MYAVEIKKIKKGFYKNKNEIRVIDNLSFNFALGKFYIIIGESGAGKSTLLKCLALLSPINYGSIIINKKNVLNLSEDELSKIRLNEIGIVFQEYNLLQFMTALENVMVPLLLDRNLTILESTIRAKKMLEYVGLNNRIDHYTKELSGGEQQRVAIARALINNPNIILADEPTGNLDNKNKKIVLELLKKVSNEGKCVIMTTHDLEVLKYADEVYSLVDGKLVQYEY